MAGRPRGSVRVLMRRAGTSGSAALNCDASVVLGSGAAARKAAHSAGAPRRLALGDESSLRAADSGKLMLACRPWAPETGCVRLWQKKRKTPRARAREKTRHWFIVATRYVCVCVHQGMARPSNPCRGGAQRRASFRSAAARHWQQGSRSPGQLPRWPVRTVSTPARVQFRSFLHTTVQNACAGIPLPAFHPVESMRMAGKTKLGKAHLGAPLDDVDIHGLDAQHGYLLVSISTAPGTRR
jgi:hypothetical protein